MSHLLYLCFHAKIPLRRTSSKSAMTIAIGSSSKLFTPLTIGNGKIELKHRVILAPLTRNRGSPLNPTSTVENPNRNWYPNDMVVEYYSQRTTDGGLIISEGINPSLQVRTNRFEEKRSSHVAYQYQGWWNARNHGTLA